MSDRTSTSNPLNTTRARSSNSHAYWYGTWTVLSALQAASAQSVSCGVATSAISFRPVARLATC
eukprot:scaffold163738_cov17-Prasinocladus_malaysianus.AAC.1